MEDARRVCQALGIRHYVQNFEREFQQHVVDYFVREYERGRTPHPCLACNDKIKFDFLLRRALFLDADFIATGHYARVQPNGAGLKLLTAADRGKDQSYVLFTLTQQELRRLLLPLGDYSKQETRRLAAEAGLAVADKPDSQEICFIPDGDYRRFVGERGNPQPGEIVDTDGRTLGTHLGVHGYTVGQRRKLGLSGNGALPMYVVAIDAAAKRVVVGPEEALMRSSLWASSTSFTSGTPPSGELEVTARIRYRASGAPATVIASGDWAEVRFHEPQRAVTPGQAVVFYQGDEVLGGGYIELDPPSAGTRA